MFRDPRGAGKQGRFPESAPKQGNHKGCPYGRVAEPMECYEAGEHPRGEPGDRRVGAP